MSPRHSSTMWAGPRASSTSRRRSSTTLGRSVRRAADSSNNEKPTPNRNEKIGKNRWSTRRPSQARGSPPPGSATTTPSSAFAIGRTFATRIPQSANPRMTSSAAMRPRPCTSDMRLIL
ncbi:hypothetical protein [Nonomuraea aridisoli]|uniref:hypothetical protein n=1 Tax=Nonomuraea aridisoli TaxID=2070368 RepID=UPI0015E8A9B3|nr:hypothetical protein [Nonomuraea aridisoli]